MFQQKSIYCILYWNGQYCLDLQYHTKCKKIFATIGQGGLPSNFTSVISSSLHNLKTFGSSPVWETNSIGYYSLKKHIFLTICNEQKQTRGSNLKHQTIYVLYHSSLPSPRTQTKVLFVIKYISIPSIPSSNVIFSCGSEIHTLRLVVLDI